MSTATTGAPTTKTTALTSATAQTSTTTTAAPTAKTTAVTSATTQTSTTTTGAPTTNTTALTSTTVQTSTTTTVAPTAKTTTLTSATTQTSTTATGAPTAKPTALTSATTQTSTTTNTTVPIYTITASLVNEPFSNELTNRSSSQFKDLEERIVGPCNDVYHKKFGDRFDHCNVKAFRSAVTRVDGTEADIEVVFNETIPIADLPLNAVVVQTFVLAVNDSSYNFTVTINPNTVQFVSSPVTDPNTTITATTTTAAPVSIVTTTAVESTTVALTTTTVTFRSLLVTFTSDLNDPTSQRFIQRSANITSQLQPRYQNAFPSSFKELKVVGFSYGSVINSLNLTFESRSVPNNTQIASVLINAAPYVTGFDIEGISITVNGIPSSGVTQKISVTTALCLVLLSWLLSKQQ